jgi:hypothetical protein
VTRGEKSSIELTLLVNLGGESYRDVIVRLEPVIMELERQDNILIVCHQVCFQRLFRVRMLIWPSSFQAIIRCLYGYFMGISQAEIPYIKVCSMSYCLPPNRTDLSDQVPLHTLIKLSPRAYGCEEERYPLPIAAVDTHRPKPNRKTNANTPVRSPPAGEVASTARDYFGTVPSSIPQATISPAKSGSIGVENSAEQMLSEKEQHATQQQADHNGRVEKEEIVTEHNAAIHTRNHKGEFVSEVHEGIDSPSQTAMLAALQQQSAARAKNKPTLVAFEDLDEATWDEELCTKPGIDGADPLQYNKRRIYCPRKECGSLILNAGSGDMVIEDRDVSSQHVWSIVYALTRSQMPMDENAPFKPDPKMSPNGLEGKEASLYWHVDGSPFAFENIGFSRAIEGVDKAKNKNIKWLICAECDLGPLGWCYEGGNEAWLAIGRVKYGPPAQ